MKNNGGYEFIIINQTGDRVWGSNEDGSGPEHWTDDSQCATLMQFNQIDLPAGGKWIHWKDPQADF